MVRQLERVAEVPGIEQLRQILEEPHIPPEAGPTTYYGYPSVKSPEWKWMIPTYFFAGGVAAGSYLAATLVDLFGTMEDRPVSRAGHSVALVAVAISPILLIIDLGRPRRFMHMLRVFKTRSPMNLGTWGLTSFGFFTGLAVLRMAVEDRLVGPESLLAKLLGWFPLRVAGLLGSLFAFFVGSYTGLLISFTNVPLWAKNHLLQGPLFVSSAMSTGLASISLALSATRTGTRHTEERLARAEKLSTLGELALTAGSLAAMGPLARPLVARPYGPPFWLGAVGLGLIAPTILRQGAARVSRRTQSRLRILASLSALVGGFIFRWVEVNAGQKQAKDDPEAYFYYAQGQG